MDVNMPGVNEYTALHIGANNGYFQICEVLL